MWRTIQSHLGWKIFISYLAVIAAGMFVLFVAAELVVPRAFDRHMAFMSTMMSGVKTGLPPGMDLNTNLFQSFRAAVTEAVTIASIAATLAALAVSVFITRQVVSPVRAMMIASQHITEGHYDLRVDIPGNPAKGELDELAQLALSFNRMAEKLSQTETMRRQLIGDVAHELRTPLTTIKGYMEGLMDGVLPANNTTYQQVHREADRLQRLVRDLQELSRVEAGAYSLNKMSIQISALISEVIAHLSQQFHEKQVTFEARIPESLPLVLADKDRIHQVLVNLVGNALQYTPGGGKVSVSAFPQGNRILISVHDNGIGISQEHLQNLFTRFYRVDKSRSRVAGGSGIGLTIAKYLVEAHGGTIKAESDGIGLGSTFSFTLPIAHPRNTP